MYSAARGRSSSYCQLAAPGGRLPSCSYQRCKAKQQRGNEGDAETVPGTGTKSTPQDPALQPIVEVPSTSKPSAPLRRTSYRRKGLDEEGIKMAKTTAQRERQAQEARVAELANTIRSSSGSDSKMRPSVMFVDGYNILYADSQLVNIANVNLALARAELEKRVEAYADVAGIRCLVVWDAMASRDAQVKLEAGPGRWVTIVYAGTSEADTWIVDKAAQALRNRAYKVVVVSKDNRIKMELADTDIIVLDAERFVEDLRSVQAGDTSAPAAWRSLWRRPRLTPYKKHEATLLTDSGYSSGSDSDDPSPYSASSQRTLQSLIGSEDLAARLETLVQEQRKERVGGLGAMYLDALSGDAGGQVGSAAQTPSDSEDDSDLDDLLTRKF